MNFGCPATHSVNYPALLQSLTLATLRAGVPVSTTGLADTPTAFEDSPQRSQSPQASDSARPLPISSTGKMRRDGDCTRLFSRLNAGRGVAPVIPQTTISSSIVLTDVSPPYLGLRPRLRTGHCPVIQVKVSSRPSLLESYRSSTDAEVYLRRSDIEEHVELNR